MQHRVIATQIFQHAHDASVSICVQDVTGQVRVDTAAVSERYMGHSSAEIESIIVEALDHVRYSKNLTGQQTIDQAKRAGDLRLGQDAMQAAAGGGG